LAADRKKFSEARLTLETLVRPVDGAHDAIGCET
jgi:hypothetical protein